MKESFLKYMLGEGVLAFTCGRDCPLPFPVMQAHQTHSASIACIDSPDVKPGSLEGIDALITDLPSIAIGVRTADCIPVLLYDPMNRVAGAVHSGWKGTVERITEKTVAEMVLRYRSNPADIRAAVGPGIGFGSYQVGEEVAMAFKKAGFPMDRIWDFRGPRQEGSMSGGHHLDLKECVRISLENSGLDPANITVSEIDTFTDSRFYSARREGTHCGRNINAIKILEDGSVPGRY